MNHFFDKKKTHLTDWLILYNAAGIGPALTNRLLTQFLTPSAIVKAQPQQLQELGINNSSILSIQHPNWSLIEEQYQWAVQPNHFIITIQDPTYPKLLKQIYAPPPLLFVNGNLDLLNSSQLAIVGSRNPTPIGIETAFQFSTKLALAGFTITSGLALGIDTASHNGALAVDGHTIAVLGSGLKRIYPRHNQNLATKILEKNGTILSEFPLHSDPKPNHFPRRNRIISGLCQGTLVVEAGIHSGSLITAMLALEQGRDVFAIPSSIYNPLSAGCHSLIQQGAKLTHHISDILEEYLSNPDVAIAKIFSSTAEDSTLSSQFILDNRHHKLLQCIGFEPTSIDQISNRSGFSAAQVSIMVLNLEINNYIKLVPSGYIRCAKRM